VKITVHPPDEEGEHTHISVQHDGPTPHTHTFVVDENAPNGVRDHDTMPGHPHTHDED
jgi:hypothetical protein